jgi:hypothetical protein
VLFRLPFQQRWPDMLRCPLCAETLIVMACRTIKGDGYSPLFQWDMGASIVSKL